MIIENIKEAKKQDREDNITLLEFFKAMQLNDGVNCGYAVFPPHTSSVATAHDQDEYSFILKGKIKSRIGEEIYEACEEDAVFIPAGEEHESINDTDQEVKIFWLMVNTG